MLPLQLRRVPSSKRLTFCMFPCSPARTTSRHNNKVVHRTQDAQVWPRPPDGYPAPATNSKLEESPLFRPDPQVRYKHIDILFTKQVEWDLIETMLPEMRRVAFSIGAGRIRPSTVLRRLATYSRKNKLYFAFREWVGWCGRHSCSTTYPISNSGEPSRRQRRDHGLLRSLLLGCEGPFA